MGLTHGGDVTGFVEEYGYMPLDCSANIAPLGLPDEVRKAIIASLDEADEYPDPLCRQLVAAIAEHEQVDEEMVLCGNGSADVIYRLALARRPRHALLCAPTFSEYAEALQLVGCDIRHHQLDPANGFTVTESIVDAIEPETDIVFLCQPNNPTGISMDRALVLKVLSRCEECDALLVVDECFVGLLDDPQGVTVVGSLARHPSLFVLKAFTKLYGMPGVRLGYGLCHDAALIEAMRAAGQPWAVSTMAQAAGIAAFSAHGYVAKVRTMVREERAFLKDEMAALGIAAQGEANFLFFHLDDDGRLTDEMRRQGVLIRDCSNYVGLHPGFYRVAVRTHEENVRLLAALSSVIAKPHMACMPVAVSKEV